MEKLLIVYFLTLMPVIFGTCGKNSYEKLSARRNYIPIYQGIATYRIDTVLDCTTQCFEESTCAYFIYEKGNCYLYETSPTMEFDYEHDTMHFARKGPCPGSKGYIHVANISLCYKLSQDMRSWTESQIKCESEGGRLLSLSDQARFDYILALISAMSYHFDAWVGMTKTEDEFSWQDGAMTPTKWYIGEPDNVSYQNCVSFGTSGNGNQYEVGLIDNGCDKVILYFCEVPMIG